MNATCEPRYRKRVPCQLVIGDGRHPGMVLNVSRGGLFVQTSARARPGDRVRIALNADAQLGAIGLEARVVWKRVSPPQLQSLTQGGVGLEIQVASEAYYDFLAGVATPAGEVSRAPGRVDADAVGTTEPGPPPSRFRVRVSQRGGPRSRTFVLEGSSEEDARRRALASVGNGWTILEIEQSHDAKAEPRLGSGS
jgi:hypothetical protein